MGSVLVVQHEFVFPEPMYSQMRQHIYNLSVPAARWEAEAGQTVGPAGSGGGDGS